MARAQRRRLPPLALLLALGLAACSAPAPPATPPPVPAASTAATNPSPPPSPAPTSGLPIIAPPVPSPVASPPSLVISSGRNASDLRVELDRLFQEHVLLLGPVLDTAVAERQAEHDAALGALDRTTQTLSQWVGAVYGLPTQRAFLDLWRARVGSFDAYARAAAHGDAPGKQQAVDDLGTGGAAVAALLAGAGQGLSGDQLGGALAAQADAVERAGDALAGHDPASADAALDDATNHSMAVADQLAMAIAGQFPKRFPGDVDRADVQLRVAVNRLLRRQVYLQALAQNAASNRRADAAGALAGALDDNIGQLGALMGSVYGQPVGDRFADLWRAYVADLGAYAEAAQSNDLGREQAATKDLDGWRQAMDELLSGANRLLASGRVSGLLRSPTLQLAGAVGGFATGRWGVGYGRLYQAALDMEPFADTLAQTTADLYPSRFGTTSAPGSSATAQAGSGGGAAAASSGGAAAASGGGPTPAAVPGIGAAVGATSAAGPAPAAAGGGQTTVTPTAGTGAAQLVATPIPIPTISQPTAASAPAAPTGTPPPLPVIVQTPVVVVTLPPRQLAPTSGPGGAGLNATPTPSPGAAGGAGGRGTPSAGP
jgi:hypothetical protein